MATKVIVGGVTGIATALGSTVLAEGVETPAEYRTLRSLGVPLFQGYLFGRPQLETLAPVPAATWDALE